MALERRPFLAKYVKNLTITASSSGYSTLPYMPMLSKVDFIECHQCRSYWWEKEVLSDVLHILHAISPNISSIELPSHLKTKSNSGLKKLINLKSLKLEGSLSPDHLESLLHIGTNPLVAFDVEIKPDAVKILRSLSSLQTLIVREAHESEHFVGVIRNLPNLTYLAIHFNYRLGSSWTRWEDRFSHCHLPVLKSLKFVCSNWKHSGLPILKDVLACLTSNSHKLEDLLISGQGLQAQSIRGEDLIQRIIKLHRNNLQKLEIPSLSISKAAITRLLRDCPELKYLHINCCEGHLVLLGQSLQYQSHIRVLKITPNYSTSVAMVKSAAARLVVTSPALRDLVITRSLDGSGDITWKRTWQYDSQLGAPIEVISTP